MTGTIAMSSSAGKAALVSSGTALAGSNPTGGTTVVDYVGFGSAAAIPRSPFTMTARMTM